MLFTDIDNDLKNLLKEYSYFHDSIVKEINIFNPDIVKEGGSIVMQDQGDEISMLIKGQLGYEVEIKLHNVTGLKILKLSGFIIFEIGIKRGKDELFFSLSGGFSDSDIYFRCRVIEINEIKPLDQKYRL